MIRWHAQVLFYYSRKRISFLLNHFQLLREMIEYFSGEPQASNSWQQLFLILEPHASDSWQQLFLILSHAQELFIDSREGFSHFLPQFRLLTVQKIILQRPKASLSCPSRWHIAFHRKSLLPH